MEPENPLANRKIIRKISQNLGMLDRSWLKEKTSKKGKKRSIRKLKSFWLTWDEDFSVRPVVCQSIKKLTYELYYNKNSTMQTLAELILKEVSSIQEISSKNVTLIDGQEQLIIKYADSSPNLKISLSVALQCVLNASETTEHECRRA